MSVGGTVTFGLLDITLIVAIVAAAVHVERRFGNIENDNALIKSQLSRILVALGIGNGDSDAEITQRRKDRGDLA